MLSSFFGKAWLKQVNFNFRKLNPNREIQLTIMLVSVWVPASYPDVSLSMCAQRKAGKFPCGSSPVTRDLRSPLPCEKRSAWGGGCSDHHIIQTSVKFHDFAELNFRWFLATFKLGHTTDFFKAFFQAV